MQEYYTPNEIKMLSCCTLCPRECGADRFSGGKGYCGTGAGMNISSVCIHKGEEPAVSGPDGICNIFFSGCNLRCIFCQNHEISRVKGSEKRSSYSLNDVIDTVEGMMSKGIRAVGFVSPSHLVPQMMAIIRGLHDRNLKPVIVYNTNGYDKAEVIDSLDGIVDVYLPDYKYASPELAKRFSDAADYPLVVLKALKRMYYQKGSRLFTDNEGRAENGMLIRHLVLPGYAEESKKVLRSIAEELSTGVNISLMSQYHPTPAVTGIKNLGRSLYTEEYNEVAQEMENLGFRNGWLQEMGSNINYRPDFSREHPFESDK
jgi:putative pyruvate formate lyase activating enzyme